MCSLGIMCKTSWQVVLTAIDFNNEAAFQTREIDNVRSERMLASKMKSECPVAQMQPKAKFRLRHVAPHVMEA